MRYLVVMLLVILLVFAFGFFAWQSVIAFQQSRFFVFGVNLAWCVWWGTKLILLAIEDM